MHNERECKDSFITTRSVSACVLFHKLYRLFFFYLNNFFGLQSAKQGTWNSIGGCRFSCPLEGWTNPFDVSPFLAKRASTGRTWPSPERRKRRWLCRRWCNYLFRWIEWSIYLLRSSNKNNTKISYNTSQYIYLEKWHFLLATIQS